MPYHVGRNSQNLGLFTESEILEGLERSTFIPSDLAWQPGMATWKPLDQVFSFAAAASLKAPPTGFDLPAGAPPQTVPHAGAAVVCPTTAGMAVASLILGVVALSMFGACFVGLVVSIPGAICGHLALGQIKRSNGQLQGHGLAMAGLVLSYVSAGLSLAFTLFFALMMAVSAAAGG
jgi:hypothetical protein